jgi:hypothetical protein
MSSAKLVILPIEPKVRQYMVGMSRYYESSIKQSVIDSPLESLTGQLLHD